MSVSPDEKQVLLSFAHSVSSRLGLVNITNRVDDRNCNCGNSTMTICSLCASMRATFSGMGSCYTVALLAIRGIT